MQAIYKVLFFLLISICSYAQNRTNPLRTSDFEAQTKWVDSVYNSLTLKERVGQLFMVQIMSNQDSVTKNKNIKLITDHKIGGIIYSTGGPVRQAKLNNELQSLSKIPLLIGMDAEWGLPMRLDSTYAFPYNMILGSIKNNNLIEQTGKHIGEHCKRLGVHFNFAPVVDINTNPKNPIIGNRSFGEDKYNVTEKALAFMRGMQGAGVLANAKHFPGHGDTDQDSHLTLPTISFDKERIYDVELFPYKTLIKEGLSSVMVAHLNVPSLESRKKYPSSLSENIVTNILKNDLGFEGLIFTDALNMKGVSNFRKPGAIDLAAFLAGNDVMLMSEDVSEGITKISEAYEKGKISEERLAHSVKKILMAKYKVGLSQYKPIKIDNLLSDLNRTKDAALYEELIENALTVIKNKKEVLPLKNLETRNIAYVKLGDDSGDTFFQELQKYADIHKIDDDNLDSLTLKLEPYNTIIVGLHRSNKSPWKAYQFEKNELQWLEYLAKTHIVILDLFVKPYALKDLDKIKRIEAVVLSYQNSKIAQQKSAQLIFGAISAKGVLPVTIDNHFKVGDGLPTHEIKRLGYSLPERVGINTEILKEIDSLAQLAVDQNMTPGIQLLIAKNGKVFYNKNFGKHTYEGDKNVSFDDVYDVASLTKILATLPLFMELEEQGVVSLEDKISEILPEYKKSNKKKITLKAMLSHYAKLQPWEAFYKKTLDPITNRPSDTYYKTEKSPEFNIEISENLFLRSDYADSIQQIIKDSDLLDKLKYKYSDFPYFILKKYIETHYGKNLDELTQNHFYKSLGANYTMYNPYKKIDKNHIVPTEIDDYYRYQLVHGYVHDMGAAMQNGIGGHAGIFSNANDVAKIMQMYLQKGFYGGKQYLKPETIDKFNTCYFCEKDNRRGVGFDKPQLSGEGSTCGCISMTSFGHSGFTGTYAWADPEKEIVYVFLSNRTYPDADNNLLLKESIRTEIQRLIYEAVEE